MKKTTLSAHIRADIEKAFPAATPIYQNSAFEAESDFFYTRKNNPNVEELENAFKALENTKYGLATTTGMSAIMLTLSLIKPNQKILINKQVYGCTYKLFQWYCEHYGMELMVADLTEENLPKDVPAVDLVFFETPTNPFLMMVDIKKVSKLFRLKNDNCVIVVDNTWASPLYQSPCNIGADISLHSSTKYISGHSDVMGGMVLTNSQYLDETLRSRRFFTGANLDPHSAWLLRRSLHTLEVRLEKQSATTIIVVEYLKNRPEVQKVYYPKIDGIQLINYATLIFLDVSENILENYTSFCKSLKLFSTGTGMACVTSMIAQPYTGSHASMNDSEKEDIGLTRTTLRLSFGLEDAEDLITDLKGAFESVA